MKQVCVAVAFGVAIVSLGAQAPESKKPKHVNRAIELLEQLGRRQALLPDDKYILAVLYESGDSWAKTREQLKEFV